MNDQAKSVVPTRWYGWLGVDADTETGVMLSTLVSVQVTMPKALPETTPCRN